VSTVPVDAGPLIALIDRGDIHHQECVDALGLMRGPMLTVWPAFTEAMYLLNFSLDAQVALWEMVEIEALDIAPLDKNNVPRMRALMRINHALPMDLADAALVRVAERDKIKEIFTLDKRHATFVSIGHPESGCRSCRRPHGNCDHRGRYLRPGHRASTGT
jgi:predicted nucleic acid-binding protein